MKSGFDKQVSRIQPAGYRLHLVVLVMEGILRNLKSCHHRDGPYESGDELERKKDAIVPCIHGLSHGLKKIANRVDVKVALSTPHEVMKFAETLQSTVRTTLGAK